MTASGGGDAVAAVAADTGCGVAVGASSSCAEPIALVEPSLVVAAGVGSSCLSGFVIQKRKMKYRDTTCRWPRDQNDNMASYFS